MHLVSPVAFHLFSIWIEKELINAGSTRSIDIDSHLIANHEAILCCSLRLAQGKMENLRIGFLNADFLRNRQGLEIRLQA